MQFQEKPKLHFSMQTDYQNAYFNFLPSISIVYGENTKTIGIHISFILSVCSVLPIKRIIISLSRQNRSLV